MIETKTANASLKRIIEHLNTLWPDETTGIAKNWEAKKWTPEALWSSLKEIARKKAKDGAYCATDEEVFGWAAHLVVDEEPGKTPKEAEGRSVDEINAEFNARLEKNKRERERRATKKAAEQAKALEPKPEPKAEWKTLEEGKDYTAETWKDLEGKEGVKKSDCEQMSLFG